MSLILTLNCGSSSLKFAIFDYKEKTEPLFHGSLTGIGLSKSDFKVKDEGGKPTLEQSCQIDNHHSASKLLMEYLKSTGMLDQVLWVGHRIVFGGTKFKKPKLISKEVLASLEKLVPFAPLHMPQSITTLNAAIDFFPAASHVACFDSSFHRTNPDYVKQLPLPEDICQAGLENFGFHGLSYEFILKEIGQLYGEATSLKRLVVAHLGHGSSICAIENGNSIDTTMGFSPNSGLVMSTRSGELDPGLVSYLLKERGFTVDKIDQVSNKESGLLAISGSSSDMVTLLKKSDDGDERAKLAIKVFTHRVRKQISAMAASIGGVDVLVFTGGIGENSPVIRSMILPGLEFIGVQFDASKNNENQIDISSNGASVQTLVIPTDEELVIARHCFAIAGFRC